MDTFTATGTVVVVVVVVVGDSAGMFHLMHAFHFTACLYKVFPGWFLAVLVGTVRSEWTAVKFTKGNVLPSLHFIIFQPNLQDNLCCNLNLVVVVVVPGGYTV